MNVASRASRFVDGGVVDDSQKFSSYGVDELGPESLPYYSRWIRQDVIGIYFLLARLTTYVRAALFLLTLIAIALWVIALK